MIAARDVMCLSTGAVTTRQTVHQAAWMMRVLQVSALPVCDDDGLLKGEISYHEMGKVLSATDADLTSVVAAGLVHQPAFTVGLDDPVEDVRQRMARNHIWFVPVIDGLQLVGVLRYGDLTKALDRRVPAHDGQPGLWQEPSTARACNVPALD